MKAQTVTNNWPWKPKYKLQWLRINGNANSQFIEYSLCYSYTTVYCGLHERNRECIHSRQWYN